jgi:hypothetical protein
MVAICVFADGDDVRGTRVFRVKEHVVWFALVEQLPVLTSVFTDKKITMIVLVPLHYLIIKINSLSFYLKF